MLAIHANAAAAAAATNATQIKEQVVQIVNLQKNLQDSQVGASSWSVAALAQLPRTHFARVRRAQ